MSAFIVDREHVRYLVDAALRLQPRNRGDFRWFHDGKWRRLVQPGCDAVAGDVTPEQAGQMLWDENIASVAYRYPDETRNSLPGPVGDDLTYGKHHRCLRVTPEQTIRAVDCLGYQSCEHPGWKGSEAHAFCDALRDLAVSRMLEGHDLAWSIDDADNVVGMKARQRALGVR